MAITSLACARSLSLSDCASTSASAEYPFSAISSMHPSGSVSPLDGAGDPAPNPQRHARHPREVCARVRAEWELMRGIVRGIAAA
jgi:hypothetical protein